MWGDCWVSPQALSVPVLMQPKNNSDTHLTPCVCHTKDRNTQHSWPGTTTAGNSLCSLCLDRKDITSSQPQLPEPLPQFWSQPREILHILCPFSQQLHQHNLQEKAWENAACSIACSWNRQTLALFSRSLLANGDTKVAPSLSWPQTPYMGSSGFTMPATAFQGNDTFLTKNLRMLPSSSNHYTFNYN